jgi:hypothetical protein
MQGIRDGHVDNGTVNAPKRNIVAIAICASNHLYFYDFFYFEAKWVEALGGWALIEIAFRHLINQDLSHLAEGLGLYLPHPLPGDTKTLAYLFPRELGWFPYAKPHPHHPFLARCEGA